MQHYVGLDVSVKETSMCIVDKAGNVIREVKVATKPAEIFAVLTEEALAIERIGLEAGPLSQWLYGAFGFAGDLCGDPTYEGGAVGTDQQERPQRCARHCTDDACWPVPTGACEDAGQPEAPHAADQSAAFAGQGPRY